MPSSVRGNAGLMLLAVLLLGTEPGCAADTAHDATEAGAHDASVTSSAQVGDAQVDAQASLSMDGAATSTGDARSSSPEAAAPIDAVSPADVYVQPEAAAAACAATADRHELYLFDSQKTDGGQPGPTHALSGIVTQQGTGFPSAALPANTVVPERPERFRFLRIQGANSSWIVAVGGVDSFGVSDGAQVTAEHDLAHNNFGIQQERFTLRSAGKLAFVYALNGSVTSLRLPDELAAEQGDAICTAQEACGSWSLYTLRVRDTAAGVSAELRPGEQKQVGRYQVLHGDNRQTVGSAKCTDWGVSRSQLIAYLGERSTSAANPCRTTQSSSLPGVHIEFPADVKCSFSLAQAAAGMVIPYATVAERAVPDLVREDTSVTYCIPDQRPTDLFTFEELSGNQQRYALVDFGLCGVGREVPPITLAAGRYPHTFSWDGRNWTGGSDTSQPKGPAFPVGVYTLRLQAKGTHGISRQPFEVLSTLEVTLTP